MLSQINFKNFRCFRDCTLSLKECTIIVGKNNAGKSTIIEGLRLIAYASYKSKKNAYRSIKMKGYKNQFGFIINPKELKINLNNIITFYEEGVAEISAKFDDASIIKIYANTDCINAFIFDKNGNLVKNAIEANKLFKKDVSILPQITPLRLYEKYLSDSTVEDDYFTYLSSLHFRNELLRSKKRVIYKEFKSRAEKTWPELRIRELDYDAEKDEYIYFGIQDSGFVSEIGYMGSGLQMWLQIIWFMCKSKGSNIVILDEPDVYLHPDLQRKLYRIAKAKFQQVIIATHSIEIMSEVDPEDIVNIDKSMHTMKYANDKASVQRIITDIGSVHNISLIRLAHTKKCIFVEGNDFKLLSKIYNRLFPDVEQSIEIIPNIDIGGVTRIDKAYGVSKLFHEEADDIIDCICIIDHDYMSEKEINNLMKKSNENNLKLYIWERKEIENYFIIPEVLFRISGLEEKQREEFYNHFEKLVETFRDDVQDSIANKLHRDNKGKEFTTCNKEARKLMKKRWSSIEEKLKIIPGKDVLSSINEWMKAEYKKSCTINTIIKNTCQADIDKEFLDVLNKIANNG